MDTGITPVDEKGRPIPQAMTDSEKLDEILILLRGFNDALEQVSKSPMLGAMGVRF